MRAKVGPRVRFCITANCEPTFDYLYLRREGFASYSSSSPTRACRASLYALCYSQGACFAFDLFQRRPAL